MEKLKTLALLIMEAGCGGLAGGGVGEGDDHDHGGNYGTSTALATIADSAAMSTSFNPLARMTGRSSSTELCGTATLSRFRARVAAT